MLQMHWIVASAFATLWQALAWCRSAAAVGSNVSKARAQHHKALMVCDGSIAHSVIMASSCWLNVTSLGSYAVVELHREPVNTMNLDFWTQLTTVLQQLEADAAMHGVIFCSGLKRDVFTAGNDILELYAPNTNAARYSQFWRVSNTFLARLYCSRLVTIAAIRGACPAGGCCLSLCCDYRIMTEQGSIGLNEVLLGIPVPKYWALLMARVTGTGPAERVLPFGKMLTPQQAKAIALVDELVPKGELQQRAEQVMQQFIKAPSAARAATKANMRADFAREWEAFLEQEAATAWAMLSSHQVTGALKQYMDGLASKAKQAKL